ncbi:glycoside hydrolase family 6 protein [Streptomyces sp. NPDC059142]|uniref:glycoside hydrolase family 6 protein n=1 Tax=unclassified Streptomyces TaxID=2593676 RepID=UPI003689E0FE
MSGRRPHPSSPSPLPSRRTRGRRGGPTVLVAALLALATAVSCAPSRSGNGAPSAPAARTHTAPVVQGEAAPSAAAPFWIDPDSDAVRQVAQWEKEGRKDDAKLLRRIADRAVAVWPAGDDPEPGIRRAVRGATADKRTAVFVAYNIPHRDCGLYSAGGAPDAAAYRDWIDTFARAIGDARTIVVLEPDALSHLADGCTPDEHSTERYELLSQAVGRLKKQPHTRVYLDAGNPDWISDPAKIVGPLQRAGVGAADGFSLNVSNFQTDDTVKTYGTRLAGLLGETHFTVDTSRNGAGPLPGNRDQAWCNPPGRALGTPPSTDTGNELVDAFLWIKRPGESDGPCRGGPPAGTWWPEYALGLARRAKG